MPTTTRDKSLLKLCRGGTAFSEQLADPDLSFSYLKAATASNQSSTVFVIRIALVTFKRITTNNLRFPFHWDAIRTHHE